MKPVRAYLVLEDGSIYEGEARGAFREMACEVVFNTSMTGYLEILTDPSYAGQGVVMTYPMIGNYGVSREDFESIRLQPCAFFLHELCDTPSNFRSTASLESVLNEFDIPCIVGLDTRAIVKKLRESGTMRGMMTDDISNMKHCMEVIGAFRQVGLVESVSITKPEIVGEGNTGPKIALMDFGVKRNIARSLASRGCEVTIYPCFATAEEIIAAKPDGLMLSNGPGAPAENVEIIANIREMLSTGIPTFGICLGHQLPALAAGAKTCKLKYGHRGANQPVSHISKSRTFITSQNHGYAVMADTLPESVGQMSYFNANDGTCEGVDYLKWNCFTVQFHPEANGGPKDTEFLFDQFVSRMLAAKGVINNA